MSFLSGHRHEKHLKNSVVQDCMCNSGNLAQLWTAVIRPQGFLWIPNDWWIRSPIHLHRLRWKTLSLPCFLWKWNTESLLVSLKEKDIYVSVSGPKKMNMSLTSSHSLSLAGVFEKTESSSSGSQFPPQGLRAQMIPQYTHGSTCLKFGAQNRPCTSQQETGAEFAEAGKRPVTHLLVSRSKASHFIVSGERKWKNKGKANHRMKGKGKPLSYGVSIIGNEEQLNSPFYDWCIGSPPLGFSRT